MKRDKSLSILVVDLSRLNDLWSISTPLAGQGFFAGDQLVAMAGRRFDSDTHVEISAVCTHPAHTGKGYAHRLINSQIRQIRTEGKIPYLHVRADNTRGHQIYEQMGFMSRSQMIIYLVVKSWSFDYQMISRTAGYTTPLLSIHHQFGYPDPPQRYLFLWSTPATGHCLVPAGVCLSACDWSIKLYNSCSLKNVIFYIQICIVPFQYLSFINNEDPIFNCLPFTIHLTCPIFLNIEQVFLDYTNPNLPVLINKEEVESVKTC